MTDEPSISSCLHPTSVLKVLKAASADDEFQQCLVLITSMKPTDADGQLSAIIDAIPEHILLDLITSDMVNARDLLCAVVDKLVRLSADDADRTPLMKLRPIIRQCLNVCDKDEKIANMIVAVVAQCGELLDGEGEEEAIRQLVRRDTTDLAVELVLCLNGREKVENMEKATKRLDKFVNGIDYNSGIDLRLSITTSDSIPSVLAILNNIGILAADLNLRQISGKNTSTEGPFDTIRALLHDLLVDKTTTPEMRQSLVRVSCELAMYLGDAWSTSFMPLIVNLSIVELRTVLDMDVENADRPAILDCLCRFVRYAIRFVNDEERADGEETTLTDEQEMQLATVIRDGVVYILQYIAISDDQEITMPQYTIYGLASIIDLYLDDDNHGYATVDDKSVVTNVLRILYSHISLALNSTDETTRKGGLALGCALVNSTRNLQQNAASLMPEETLRTMLADYERVNEEMGQEFPDFYEN